MSSPAIARPSVQMFSSQSQTKAPRDIRGIVLLTLVSLAITAPALVWGIPTNRNLYNHFRFTLPFYDAIWAGNWYPGWLAESNAGFGDPSFRFYPPGVYYLLVLTRSITGSWFGGSLLTIFTLFALGAIGVYFWACEFVSSKRAVWAGVLYTVAPYHLVQIYQAFLLAEFAGAAILPFVFAFTERFCRRRQLRDVAGLAISYALLIFTHLPLAVIGSITLLLYSLLRLEKKTAWRTIVSLSLGAGLGLAASASYWTTMVAELYWIRADRIQPDASLDYRNNFILSTFSPENLNVWWMNMLLLATLALFWPGLASFRRSAETDEKRARVVSVLFLLTAFMATVLSRPIWYLFHPLQETQFPWRWLALTSMFGPIAVVVTARYWIGIWQSRKRAFALLVAGTMLASLAFSFSHTIREAGFLSSSEFAKVTAGLRGSQGISYWWPVWSTENPRPMKSEVDAGNRSVTVETWNAEKRTFKVGDGDAVEARVRTFYYPHWQATAGGKLLHVRPDSDGALLISVPSNQADVTLEFKEPRRVRWAMISATAAWIVLTLMLAFGTRLRLGRHLSTSN